MEKLPILVVFDIDGTLARTVPSTMTDDEILACRPITNLVRLARKCIEAPQMEVMICTARPKRVFRPTWAWLNRHLGIGKAPRAVSVVCRPDDVPDTQVATYKLSEIVQAIRRMSSRPSQAWIYDDRVENLRLFQTLRSHVIELRLFLVDEGVATQWSF